MVLALKNSLDIQIAKYDYSRKEEDLPIEESIFEPIFDGVVDFSHNRLDQGTVFFGNKTDELRNDLNLKTLFRSGTKLRVSWMSNLINTNSPFTVFNPRHETDIKLSLIQSLGKNYFGLQDRSNIKITKIDIENSEYTSLDDIEGDLFDVQIAYWTLVLRYEELRIVTKFKNKAQKLYEVYLDRINIGLAEEVDLLTAQSNLEIRRNNILLAQLRVELSNNELTFLLNTEDVFIKLKPVNVLEVKPVEVDFYSSLKKAIEHRWDYSRLKNQLDINNIDIVIKDNNLWPEIDLEATYERNGVDNDFWTPIGEIFNKNQFEWFVGVTLEVPLGFKKAKAELSQSKISKRQLLLSIKRLERDILKEVNNSIKEIQTNKGRVDKSYLIANIEKNKLEQERRRARSGRSNSDILTRFENDYLQAQINLARNLFEYRISIIELERVQNTLLGKYWKGRL